MRSVNKRIGMRWGDGPKALFRFQWLLFALVFAAAALQVSPSKAHSVSPTPIADVNVSSFSVGGSDPPDRHTVRLVYQREGVGPDVTLFYFLIEPEATDHPPELQPDLPSKAVIVLFLGGNGKLGFTVDRRTSGLGSNNFLVRNRRFFAAAGPFVVAVIDAARNFHEEPPENPQCSTDSGSGLSGCRLSTAHMIDVANVVQDLKIKFPMFPVWLVGTSRGTISAASAAARLINIDPADGDGLVLTATLTDDPADNRDVFDPDAHLELIDVPVLIATHHDDKCIRTPPSDRFALAAALVAAPEVMVRLFNGGYLPISDACSAPSPHQFSGIDDKVIRKIVMFINDNI